MKMPSLCVAIRRPKYGTRALNTHPLRLACWTQNGLVFLHDVECNIFKGTFLFSYSDWWHYVTGVQRICLFLETGESK
jgi:hypothetical protein